MSESKISCIRLLPYRQFADGTWGSILVVDWLSGSPSVFLFNSAERKRESPNTARNYLLPEEEASYARYIEEGEGLSMDPRDAYGKYRVARLAGRLLSAHISDLVCKNLNAHNPANRHKVDRANRLLTSSATHQLQEELAQHTSEKTSWERGILEQTLPLIAPGYNHQEWLETVSKIISDRVTERKQSRLRKEEKGILAVSAAGICRSKADWGAVFKLLTERKVATKGSYLAGARIINRVCGKEVTTAAALKQSPAMTIIGGTIAKGWTDKLHNRQSTNLLMHYQEIAEVFLKNDSL